MSPVRASIVRRSSGAMRVFHFPGVARDHLARSLRCPEVLGHPRHATGVRRRRDAEKVEEPAELSAHVGDQILVAQLEVARVAERAAGRPAAPHAVRPRARCLLRRVAPGALGREHAIARVAHDVDEARLREDRRQERDLAHVLGRLVAPDEVPPGRRRVRLSRARTRSGRALRRCRASRTAGQALNHSSVPIRTPRRCHCQNARVPRSACTSRAKLARSARLPYRSISRVKRGMKWDSTSDRFQMSGLRFSSSRNIFVPERGLPTTKNGGSARVTAARASRRPRGSPAVALHLRGGTP